MRRFDKDTHINKANLLVEQRYLDSKMSIEEQEFKATLTEISEDNFFGETKEKQQVNEVFVLSSLAFILSIGKFMDLIGVIFKKINNIISKKKIDKTKFEKWGEKYTHLLVKGIKFYLKSTMALPDDQADKVAKIILVCLITSLWGGAAFGSIEGLHGLAGVAKSFAQLVKSYEVGMAISAILLYGMYDEIRTAGSITDLPHAMEACLEDTEIRKGIKQAKESKMGKQMMVGCIVKNMQH